MKTTKKPRTPRTTLNKRSTAQRQQDLADIARLLREGKAHREIADWIRLNRPYKLSRTQITYDSAELMRTHGGKVAEGLFRLTKPGYKVYSASDLTAKGYPGAAGGEIYAVFEVEPDAAYVGRKWDEPEVTKQIKAFESRRAYRQVNTLHRRSPDPRVLSLQELLRPMR